MWENKRTGALVQVLATRPDELLGGHQCRVRNIDTGHIFRIHQRGLLERYRELGTLADADSGD